MVKVSTEPFKPGLPVTDIREWEKEHDVGLPEDVVSFYSTANGVGVRWSTFFLKRDWIEVGHIHIPPLSSVTTLNTFVPLTASVTASEENTSTTASDVSAEEPGSDARTSSTLQCSLDLAIATATMGLGTDLGSEASHESSSDDDATGIAVQVVTGAGDTDTDASTVDNEDSMMGLPSGQPGENSMHAETFGVPLSDLDTVCCGQERRSAPHSGFVPLQQQRMDRLVCSLLGERNAVLASKSAGRDLNADQVAQGNKDRKLRWAVLERVGDVGLIVVDCCVLNYDWTPSRHHGSVWLVEVTGTMHRIARSFSDYYRLLLTHLGIKYWQLLLTPLRPPPVANFWFQRFIPKRLHIDRQEDTGRHDASERRWKANHIHHEIDKSLFVAKEP